jgi:hypothetical protein
MLRNSETHPPAVAERAVQHQQLPPAVGLRGVDEAGSKSSSRPARFSWTSSTTCRSYSACEAGSNPYGPSRRAHGRGRRSRSAPRACPTAPRRGERAPGADVLLGRTVARGLTTTTGTGGSLRPPMTQSGISTPQSIGAVAAPGSFAPKLAPTTGMPSSWRATTACIASSRSTGHGELHTRCVELVRASREVPARTTAKCPRRARCAASARSSPRGARRRSAAERHERRMRRVGDPATGRLGAASRAARSRRRRGSLNEFSRSTSRSRKPSASMSTPTCEFGSRPLRRHTSTTVRPRQSSDSSRSRRSACSSRRGRVAMTCATATASWIGEPSKP